LKKKIMLIGGGGHCHSVVDSVIALGLYDEIGIVDTNNHSYLGVSVIGADNDIPGLIKDGWTEAFITVGSVGNTAVRRKLYQMVKSYNLNVPVIIDPSAIIAKNVEIKEGTFLGKRAVINAGTSVGICSIINTGAVVEHDCVISDFAHISPGTVLCGQVTVGDDSHVGAGSVVRQLITIGSESVIGAGSVVVKNIPDKVKAYGNPCKVIE
jgi:sugar O-acyltransferase, sialic acid O-acetyltransferase NeuD family